MSSIDLISMAVRNLWKRKMRTFLTVLGVVIGTASIIVMISLGIGMSKSFEEQLSQWGNIRVIDVYKPYNYTDYGNGIMAVGSSGGSKGNNETILNDEAIEAIKQIDGVQTASPIINLYLYFLAKNKYVSSVSVNGIEPELLNALNYTTSEGRLLQDGDELCIVFGSSVGTMFYNPNSRNRYNEDRPQINLMTDKLKMSYDWSLGRKNSGSSSKVKPYDIIAVGILEGDNYEVSYNSYIPLEYAKKIQKEQQKFQQNNQGGGSSTKKTKDTGYENAKVLCTDTKVVQQVQEQIKAMGFETSSLSDSLQYMNETSASLQKLLGAIGAVSLFVAAIGITNTMVMSIHERTKEIGVMKVIGASLKDIKRLFLVEAALIGFFGGLLGIAISLLLSHFLNSSGTQILGNMMGIGGGTTVSYIPSWLCGAALLFSAFVGILSGYFPARRAMKLSALSAIRSE